MNDASRLRRETLQLALERSKLRRERCALPLQVLNRGQVLGDLLLERRVLPLDLQKRRLRPLLGSTARADTILVQKIVEQDKLVFLRPRRNATGGDLRLELRELRHSRSNVIQIKRRRARGRTIGNLGVREEREFSKDLALAVLLLFVQLPSDPLLVVAGTGSNFGA